MLGVKSERKTQLLKTYYKIHQIKVRYICYTSDIATDNSISQLDMMLKNDQSCHRFKQKALSALIRDSSVINPIVNRLIYQRTYNYQGKVS